MTREGRAIGQVEDLIIEFSVMKERRVNQLGGSVLPCRGQEVPQSALAPCCASSRCVSVGARRRYQTRGPLS